MTDLKHREMMGELYRLWEKYENPPKTVYTEDAIEFWTNVCNDTVSLYEKYKDDTISKELIMAFCCGLDEQWKIINPNPMVDKPSQPEQLNIF